MVSLDGPRIFAVPDIHGRYDLLKLLLAKLHTEAGYVPHVDKLIFLGDMVDRGPQSRQVLETVKALTDDGSAIALVGNHEDMMLNALQDKPHAKELWYWNGGRDTVGSFLGWGGMRGEIIGWLARLPTHHEEPGFFFSHAPLPREENRDPIFRGAQFMRQEYLWTSHHADRDMTGRRWTEGEFARELDNGVRGVCGHVHALFEGKMEPRFYEHYIFADAGCGCHDDAPLVAIEVKSGKVTWAWPRELSNPS